MRQIREKAVSIGPGRFIPRDFQEAWGGDMECPAYDSSGNLVGYVAFFPDNDESFEEAMETFMAI